MTSTGSGPPPLMKRIASGSWQTRVKSPEYSSVQRTSQSRPVSASPRALVRCVIVRQA